MKMTKITTMIVCQVEHIASVSQGAPVKMSRRCDVMLCSFGRCENHRPQPLGRSRKGRIHEKRSLICISTSRRLAPLFFYTNLFRLLCVANESPIPSVDRYLTHTANLEGGPTCRSVAFKINRQKGIRSAHE